jgi:hypothetical protein
MGKKTPTFKMSELPGLDTVRGHVVSSSLPGLAEVRKAASYKMSELKGLKDVREGRLGSGSAANLPSVGMGKLEGLNLASKRGLKDVREGRI